VSVASARGVADRWRDQYQNKDGSWSGTVSGGGEGVYKKLCALGHNPDINAVAEAIGNKSWSHLTCIGCGDSVERAADFGSDYSDQRVLLCCDCLSDGLRAILPSSDPQGSGSK
jgi:hypothetical protein